MNFAVRRSFKAGTEKDLRMRRVKYGLLALLAIGLAGGSASAQVTTGGAANTGIPAPSVTGGVRTGTVGRDVPIDTRNPPAPAGNAASGSNSAVPGTTPGVNINGAVTSGPPGTGGAAGGPSLGGQ